MKRILIFALFFVFCWRGVIAQSEHSVARQWNEVLLQSIREDYARPTVHARNLFHISAAMYDAWTVYESQGETYFLTNYADYPIVFNGVPDPVNITDAREEAISYAAFRILKHRFQKSPNKEITLGRIDSLFIAMGYDSTFVSMDYESGIPAALGNYIASQIITFGLQDGSNEENEYANQYYTIVNIPIAPDVPGNTLITDPNRWQPIALETFIDQSGNEIPGGTQPFLSPEWGNVTPFALQSEDKTTHSRDGHEYQVYHDPGPPPFIQSDGGGTSSEYQWGFTLVSLWSAHLDPADNVMIDISPASIGNNSFYPTTLEGLRDFYIDEGGGDPGPGHDTNPVTGMAYEPNIVPRGDYTRVLAEFWADGPDSETPPGHWFTILNYVNDHPDLIKKYRGEGEIMDDLEWDIKSYFALGGAMHDAAISAWGIKGYYDYLRPVSAIRYMSDQGQSTDSTLDNYSKAGIPLTEGLVEVVEEGDPLAGVDNEHVGKIKLYAWRGPDYIDDPELDVAGVGWILAENWWPYQRPTFVTPPFAGYVSGHSTYSRAAAEVLTRLTGDSFFPGGMAEFIAKANEFLVFEEGPSVDVKLQWATYKDASDQTSLSRIWGGIHPPADDMPGRLIGEKVGIAAFELADQYYNGIISDINYEKFLDKTTQVYPNPVINGGFIRIINSKNSKILGVKLISLSGKMIDSTLFGNNQFYQLDTDQLTQGVYLLSIQTSIGIETHKIVIK